MSNYKVVRLGGMVFNLNGQIFHKTLSIVLNSQDYLLFCYLTNKEHFALSVQL